GGNQTTTGGLTPGVNLFTTISAAVAAANPNDTINVADGTYPEQIDTVGKAGLIFQGNFYLTNGNAVTRGANETVVTGVGNAGRSPFYVRSDDVQIAGFTVQGQ